MQWIKSESGIEPQEIDTTSSKAYNYIRRNIATEERESDGEIYTMYVYDECRVPKEAWGIYEELIQAQADIDYLNMITGDL